MNSQFDAKLNWAIVNSNKGNQLDAIKIFLECQSEQPENPWVLLNLANCYIKDFQENKARDCFNLILKLKISDSNLLLQLNQLAIRTYSFDIALMACKQALCLSPNSLDIIAALIEAKKESRSLRGIKRLCKNMVINSPNHWWPHYQLANNYLVKGKFKDAEKAYKKSLENDSNSSFIYAGLVKVKKYKDLPARLLNKIDQAIKFNSEPESKARLYLSKSKLLNDSQYFEEAWNEAQLGKSIKHSIAPFDSQNFKLHVKRIKSYFSLPRTQQSISDKQPIFIVGMPRSGTTLIEQVLSTSSDVYPGGETPALESAIIQQFKGQNYTLQTDRLSQDQLDDLVIKYEGFFKRFSNFNNKRIVDKVPMNFMHLGLLAQMYPKAKFVNIERNKFDVCTSIFFQNFNINYQYTHKIEDIIKVYDCYSELMLFWYKSLDVNQLLTVDYKDLIMNYDNTRAEICSFTNLKFTETTNYKKSKNIIETPSVWQARQGVYKTSINRWKKYPQMVKLAN